MRSKLAHLLAMGTIMAQEALPELRNFTPIAKPPKPKKNNGFARNRRKAMKKRRTR